MKIHRFDDADLRILGMLAIDLFVEHLAWKVVKFIDVKENYWSIDVRFALTNNELDTNYDSLHINCGRDNDPTTYQMAWTKFCNGEFKKKPITSPLVVVSFFEYMCNKEKNMMN